MPTEFDKETEIRYAGMYVGLVCRNDDPENLGRVKVAIEALVSESCWAYPMGGPGGGIKDRGWFDVPPKGAAVVVFFHKGDVDVPFYMPAHWGHTDADGCETPSAACDIAKEDAHKVKTYETARYQMVWDERDGKEKFRILDKVSGDFVSMDPTNGITLLSPLKVVVDAPKIYLGGDNLDENPITGEGVALAQTLDTFSGTTAGQRGQASTRVFAKKI